MKFLYILLYYVVYISHCNITEKNFCGNCILFLFKIAEYYSIVLLKHWLLDRQFAIFLSVF